jgi:hypothetical protein
VEFEINLVFILGVEIKPQTIYTGKQHPKLSIPCLFFCGEKKLYYSNSSITIFKDELQDLIQPRTKPHGYGIINSTKSS